MYLDYILEREGKLSIKSDKGFIVYGIYNQIVFVHDFYVMPEHRMSGEGFRLADMVVEVGRKNGCKVLQGHVIPSSKGSTEAMKVQLAYGMRIESAFNDCIVMSKEI